MASKKRLRKKETAALSIVPAQDAPDRAFAAPPNRARTAGICAVLAVMCLIVFCRVFQQDFINLDDGLYVSENTTVKQGLTEPGLRYAFTETVVGHYHPLTMLSFMLDVSVFGARPGAMKGVNLALHILNTLLLFGFLQRITRNPWAAAAVAALFAVHPQHVEPVVWIASRKDMLSTGFLFLTLWAYVRYTERRGALRYALTALLLTLGLLSKATLMTAPVLMLLLDFWPLDRCRANEWRGLLRRLFSLTVEKIPFFVLAAAAAIVAAYAASVAMGSLENIPLKYRGMNAVASYGVYLLRTVWPHHLALLYPHPVNLLPMGYVIISLLVLLAISAVAIGQAFRRPYLLMGWMWYGVVLLPVIGLTQAGDQASADRYSYVSLIGVFIMLAWGIPDLLGNRPLWKPILIGGALVSLVAFAALSFHQVGLWKDSETIFRHTLQVTARNAKIETNLGTQLRKQGRLDEALALCSAAVRDNPAYAEGWSSLGNVLYSKGDYPKAMEHYQTALRLDPKVAGAYNNLGNALCSLGRTDEALTQYRRALELDPKLADAHSSLGGALFLAGKYPKACAELREAIRLNPEHADALRNLAVTLLKMGDLENARNAYIDALRVSPNTPELHNGLGNALFMMDRLEEAIAEYRKVLQLDPGSADAHFSLAGAHARLKRYEEAAQHYRETLRLKPGYPGAQHSLQRVEALHAGQP